MVFRGVVKRSTKSAWYPAGRAQPRPTRRPSRGRRRQGLARSGIPSTRTLYERHGRCSYCCTRGTVAAALLYIHIILVYHPEMVYVPVCRTTITAVCRFRVSCPALPGTRHDTTRVSTSAPNENVDHEELQLALGGCWQGRLVPWSLHYQLHQYHRSCLPFLCSFTPLLYTSVDESPKVYVAGTGTCRGDSKQ